jgi:hypothetical protein
VSVVVYRRLDTTVVILQKTRAALGNKAVWDQRSKARTMSSEMSSGGQSPEQAEGTAGSKRPDWADGLRQLYDSVVDEPLPDAFKDLLEKLDEGVSDEGREAEGSDGSPG